MIAALALASSVVWGTADFVGGRYARRIAALQVVAVSQIGGLAVITAVLLAVLVGGDAPDGLGFLAPGLASGAVGAIGLTAFYAALSAGRMGVVSPIAALGAVVPVVLGLLGGDRLGPYVLLGLTLAVAGAVLTSGPELSGGASRRPVLLAVVAALGFGLALYLLDQASRQAVVPALWAMRVGSVLLLLAVIGARSGRPRQGSGRVQQRDLPGLVLLGSADLAANALFGLATARGQVSVTAVLGSLYPLATVLWARLLLGERIRRVQYAGVGLALVGVALTVA